MARSLERVGEWWSILILRDAYYGYTRFDEFQRSLGIAPNILTRRLHALVESGLLERHRYSDKPPRHEYLLTERGRDFRPVLLVLMAWGNKHFAEEGLAVYLADADADTGEPVEIALVDQRSGARIGQRHVVRAGPAATERMRERVEIGRQRRALAPADSPSST